MRVICFIIPFLPFLFSVFQIKGTAIYNEMIHKKINNQIHILKHRNYNTNVGVYIGEKSIVLIDPMIGNNRQEILLEEIRKLSDKPIEYVINTHSHPDHSGANSFYNGLGATIISQENAKYSTAKTKETFKENYILKVGEETIRFFHFTSHTMDDALVYFEKSNVLFLGDNYMDNWLPHFFVGGSVNHLKIINKAISLANENSYIIPAHGSLTSNKVALTKYKENAFHWVDRIICLNSKGYTIKDIYLDEQIQQLIQDFNVGNNNYSGLIQNLIRKTIAVEIFPKVQLSPKEKLSYVGSFKNEEGLTNEVVLQNGKLYFRRKRAFMYEMVSESKTTFILRGLIPKQQVSFEFGGNGEIKKLIYFDGSSNVISILSR